MLRAKVIYKAILNPEDVSSVKNKLANQMVAINRAKINYFAAGPNSNSTVGTALRNIDINIQIPKGMWVPGFEQQLIDRDGLRASTVVEGVSTYANSRNTVTNEGYQRNFVGATPTPGDFSNVNAPGQSTDLSAGKALGKENNKENFPSMDGDSLINSVDTDKMQRNINIFDTVNNANQINGAYPDKMQRNLDAFSALSGVRNPLEIGASGKQLGTPPTNNADLDKALAMLNGMKQDNLESVDKQSTTPEPVAVGSGKDNGMER
jgi:hypothetical protein